MRIQTSPERPIRIFPQANVLPANTLRFYIHFPRSGEAYFDRDHLWLLNEDEQMVRDPFLVLSQELWSVDGHRLTVLMEPRRIKRGLGADPSHEPALVVGRTYSLVVTALGQTARHTFHVSEPVLEAIDETRWRIDSPTVGSLDPAVVHFDRVMDAALCEDEIAVLSPSGGVAQTRESLAPDGTSARFIPSHPWRSGEHCLVVSEHLEDVCGNRLGEALDHELGAGGPPRAATISFTTRGHEDLRRLDRAKRQTRSSPEVNVTSNSSFDVVNDHRNGMGWMRPGAPGRLFEARRSFAHPHLELVVVARDHHSPAVRSSQPRRQVVISPVESLDLSEPERPAQPVKRSERILVGEVRDLPLPLPLPSGLAHEAMPRSDREERWRASGLRVHGSSDRSQNFAMAVTSSRVCNGLA
jgi:hypothetical protein